MTQIAVVNQGGKASAERVIELAKHYGNWPGSFRLRFSTLAKLCLPMGWMGSTS